MALPKTGPFSMAELNLYQNKKADCKKCTV